MIGALPEALRVGETEYQIRTDYRDVLQVFEAFSDPDLYQEEKWIVAIYLLLEPFACSDDVFEAIENGFDFADATKQISWFISAGHPEEEILEKPVYDWAQDEQMIFSAVNKVAGKETRELPYLHWWTFLGYFNEIGAGTFRDVVGIRDKRNRHKKLEKHELEFLKRNKNLVNLTPHKTKEKIEEDKIWDEIL